MKLSSCILSALVFGTAILPVVASADDLRERQTAACSSDAMRLCSDFVPDEKRIAACMMGKRASLSSGCRVFFSASKDATTEHRSAAADE